MGYSQLFQQPTSTLDTSLVAKYYFNGNVNDESGNGYNGTNNGATLTTNRFGIADKAYSFDGLNDYIDIPILLGTTTPTLFSISMWVNCNNSVGENSIFSQSNDITDKTNIWIAILYGKVYYIVFDPVNFDLRSNLTINNNKWYHIVVVRNGSRRSIYINGKLDISDNLAETYTGSPITKSYIGKLSTAFHRLFNGKIDDIRIYSKVLTTEEIKALYRERPDNSLYLYNYGYEYDTWIQGYEQGGGTRTVTKNADNLEINIIDDGVNPTDVILWQTPTKIDLSNYSKIIIELELTASTIGYGGFNIGMVTTSGLDITTPVILTEFGYNFTKTEFEVDISSFTQENYICFRGYVSSNESVVIKMYKLQLIP